MKATHTRHGWVHMFTTHRPTLTLQLHNFDLFRTCRTALLCGNWQDFNWHQASRGPSAIAELLIKSVNIWQSYKQERGCVMHCAHLANTLPKGEESAHSHRLSNKPFLICLLTTPPHLKYVATLPCNLSLMACFADLNVVCSDMCKVRWDFFWYPFNCKFTMESSREEVLKSVKVWGNYGNESVAPIFGPSCRWLLLRHSP